MKVKFNHVVWSNSNGASVTKAGAKEFRHASKLVRNGLASMRVVSRKFLGYGRTMDTGTSLTVYEVSIK